jgi:uncharacterized protein YjbI with pentapeptide repeats
MAELTRRELVLALASVPAGPCPPGQHLVRLAGVDLNGLDLRGLNLAHADLAGANLRGCDLSDARLTGCDFAGADLTGATLRGVFAEAASFAGATLVAVDFRHSERDLFFGTSLAGADFRGADLSDAILAGADLCGADLRDALLERVDFTGARLDARTRLSVAAPRCDVARTPPDEFTVAVGLPPRLLAEMDLAGGGTPPPRPDPARRPARTAPAETRAAA